MNSLPNSLQNIIRCGQCRHFSLGTIAKPGCKLGKGQKHWMTKACETYENIKKPVKKTYQIATFNILDPD